jgi:tellurite resistance protein TerC
MTEIAPWHWLGFIVLVLALIALDLGVFHRRPHAVKITEAAGWSAAWFALAMLFAAGLAHWRGREEAEQFFTGYVIELSLSLDNLLVIALIFTAFKVPAEFQQRVLIWGILGALATRGAMIVAGAALIQRFEWVLYLFGAYLVFVGVKIIFKKSDDDPEKNFVLRLARKFFPVTDRFEGQRFFSRQNGRAALTPLALVLLVVETSDLIFAVDSVPAVFSVTRKAFIVFTANVFAVLGLRSLYFLLAGAIGNFRYLKIGLSVVLVFIGAKMLLDPHESAPKWFQVDISNGASLLTVAAILAAAIALSLFAARKEGRATANGHE